MTLIRLSALDLTCAAVLVVLLAAISGRAGLGTGRPLLVASLRMVVQLALIGLVLKALFSSAALGWVALLSVAMLLVAGREVTVRQRRRLSGGWGYGVGTGAMFISSFAVTIFALLVIIRPDPWHDPRYAVPLLGMLLGNTMNGVSLGLNHLFVTCHDQREQVEQRLMLGESFPEATASIRQEAIHTGLIPIINAMVASGVVSLPGLMTGQILAGTPPTEAVRYQMLIMFLVAAGTGFGLFAAVWAGSKRLTDPRHRLRLDHLTRKYPLDKPYKTK